MSFLEVRSNKKRFPIVTKILVFFLSTSFVACGGFVIVRQQVTPNYQEIRDDLVFRAASPVARELRYTIIRTTHFPGSKSGSTTVSTNIPKVKNTKEGIDLSSMHMKASAGTKWSEIFSKQAERASLAGDHALAAQYYNAAISARQTEIKMERHQAFMDFIYAGIGAVSQILEHEEAKTLVKWIMNTTNCIGEDAPEGSVLYLTAQYVSYFQKYFDKQSRHEFMVSMALDDGKGRVITSLRYFELFSFTNKSDDRKLLSLGRKDKPELIPEKLIDLTDVSKEARFIDFNNVHFASGYPIWWAVLSNSAIKDIYMRIDALKKTTK